MLTTTEHLAQKSYALRLSDLHKKDKLLSSKLSAETVLPKQIRLLRRRRTTLLKINAILTKLNASIAIELLNSPIISPFNQA